MTSHLPHRCADDFASLSPQEKSALLASAQALSDTRRTGAVPPALHGRNIGLLCGAAADASDIALLTQAAAALGCRVARVGPDLPSGSTPQRLQASAQLLGRLYDAVVCLGVEPDLVHGLGKNAGIPVFDSIGTPGHPIATLADAWAAAPVGSVALGTPAERRCALIQAVLLDALS
ncbi:ornithine carbamoyltransferase [Aquincola sp. MAHUQ-54]|uniref:Ornithine carbamoyltransferase n=1 Tax=Aquincola agrisoli TaxID=3119538 RepID=A0AAW9QC22_9BURK